MIATLAGTTKAEKVDRNNYLNIKQIKERGWTDTLIEKLLGSPDATATNPMYHSAAPMKLFSKERVEAVEATLDFQEALSKAMVRSQASKKAADVRLAPKREARAAFLAQEATKGAEIANQLTVTVARLPLDEVQRRALEAHKAEWGNKECDPSMLERNTVNFIRHHMTEYDESYALLPTSSNRAWATSQFILRKRVYDEIARAYPTYAEECQRQMNLRTPDEVGGLPRL